MQLFGQNGQVAAQEMITMQNLLSNDFTLQNLKYDQVKGGDHQSNCSTNKTAP